MSTHPRPRAGRVSAKLVIALVGAIIVVMGVCAYFFLLRQGPEQVVRQYLMAFAMQDIPAMLPLIPSDLAEQLKTELKGEYPEPVKNPQIPEMEIGKAEIKGNYAYVPVKMKTGTGLAYAPTEQTLRMALVKEGGRWKVDPMATAAASQGPGEEMGLPPLEGGAPGMETVPPAGPEPGGP